MPNAANDFRSAVLLLPVMLLMGVLSGCAPEPAELTGAPASPAEPGYVGAQSCRQCHTEQFDLWRGSHHDLAMQPATPATALGDFSGSSFVHNGVSTRFFAKGAQLFVNTDGPDGELADFPVLYTFGVEPLQQYLVELPDGKIQALSVAWDSRAADAGGQRWFHLYGDEAIPHTDVLHWTRPSQNWETMCADCHSTALISHYDVATDRFDTHWEELNVACEACHGPGQQHVEWANAGAGAGSNGLSPALNERHAVSWVTDPATGNSQRSVAPGERPEIEACAGCHSRRMRLSIATPPDHPFLDGYSPALIQPPLYHADGQILDEVYVYGSFLQSRMYGAGVTCSDCHEPHSLELRAPGGQVCLQCHLGDKYATVEHQLHPEGAGNPDCIACHMPATTYMQVDERSDHSFRVPRPDLSVRYGLPNACSACHAQGDEWAADILTEAGRLSAGSHWRDKLVASYAYGYESVQNLAELALDSEVPAIIRASAASRLQMDYNPGSLQLLTALTTNDDALIRRGAAQALQASHPQLAVELGPALLDDPIRAVRLVTVSALARVDPVLLPAGSHTRLQRALDEYIEIQLVNSERAESYLNIATMRRSQNQLEDAESALRVAMQLNEHFVPVYINLADLYRLWEREAEAEQTLRQGLQKVPEDPSLHHALGLSLVRQAKTDAALAELQLAADSAAASPRYALVYAVALDSSGKTRDAVAYLQVAVKRFANDPQLVQLLEELKSR